MQPGATVRVDIRDDADYLPVELDSWTATEGTPTGKWGEYLIEDDVRLLNRMEEQDEIEMKLIIDLPEGGKSEDQVNPGGCGARSSSMRSSASPDRARGSTSPTARASTGWTPEGVLVSGESGECVAPDRSRRAAPIPAPKASPTPARSRAKTRCSLRSTTA